MLLELAAKVALTEIPNCAALDTHAAFVAQVRIAPKVKPTRASPAVGTAAKNTKLFLSALSADAIAVLESYPVTIATAPAIPFETSTI